MSDDNHSPDDEPLRELGAQWHLGDEDLDEALALDDETDPPEGAREGAESRDSVVVDLASRRARLRH